MRTGIVSVPRGILYEALGEEEGRLEGKGAADELLMGWAVELMEESGGFQKVRTHYGYEGYLDKREITEVPLKVLMERDRSDRTGVISRKNVDVMELPKVQSRVLRTLFLGSLMAVGEETVNGYRRIKTWDGTAGYIPEISWQERRDRDGYFYARDREHYFAVQDPGKEEWELRRELTEQAMKYLFTQYRWGGKTPEGIDCSGLTFMSYAMCGILIYRDAQIRPGYPLHEILPCSARTGDLLYFPGHVAMYLGGGSYIHATAEHKSFGCVVNSLNPQSPDFRADLAESLTAAASLF